MNRTLGAVTAQDAYHFIEHHRLADAVAELVDDAPPLPDAAKKILRNVWEGGRRGELAA